MQPVICINAHFEESMALLHAQWLNFNLYKMLFVYWGFRASPK